MQGLELSAHPLMAAACCTDACAESRCQASHKKAMETANEAKRLAPLEPQVARLQDALSAAHAELERVQREVTAHQTSIRQGNAGRSWLGLGWRGKRVCMVADLEEAACLTLI